MIVGLWGQAMHQSLSRKLLLTTAAAGLCMTAVGTAQAQFANAKEIERETRVQWLTMKRDLPKPADPRIQPFVECVAWSIIEVLEEPYSEMNWEVVVFDDEAINAFAMVGGQIGVFTGIFKVADTVDSLAAVIGHEIAHVTENHVMARARRQMGGDILEILAGAVGEQIGRGIYDPYGYNYGGYGSSVGREAGRTLAQFGLLFPFSRGQESDADMKGMEYMARAGYDPRASIELWKNMAESREGEEPAEFASTHPSDDRRIYDLVSSMAPALVLYNESLEERGRAICTP
ncbi:MAG: M48 family metallopeptidase, partial [Rhodospirillaceae bacterium]|nr:M48 family metallopeptidase [Rhodospirillaceae bacterium]